MSFVPESSAKAKKVAAPQTCGIVMPISQIDGCSETHWTDVLEIHTEAIESAGFAANLVSNAEEVGIIQKRIIQNLYSNPIVVCDVSGKNPNVMFELGMRLAFDRPVVIVKDDKTSYSFDTSPIEHLTYPRDLRFAKIVNFKAELRNKIAKTAAAAERDTDFSPFLSHFGEFKVAKIDTKEVSGQEFILDELKALRRLLTKPKAPSRQSSLGEWFEPSAAGKVPPNIFTMSIGDDGQVDADVLREALLELAGVVNVKIHPMGKEEILFFEIHTNGSVDPADLKNIAHEVGAPPYIHLLDLANSRLI